MLTIKAPIEPVTRAGMVKDHEELYQRIRANYGLIASEITPEDLLHVVTTPPEIYLAEGDMTTVTGTTVLNSHREENLEIINNVLNRIMVSADMPLTYQDRTYITDVLRKIGIRDDRKFMNEVYRMMQETRDTNELISLYLSRPEEFRRYVSEYNDRHRVEITQESEAEAAPEERAGLAESILTRLETGAIYQILSNFNRSITENRVDAGGLMISEQSYTAQQILLSRIREAAFREPPELVYRSENIYEDEFDYSENREQNVTNEISSAVLLDLIRNLYHSEFDKIQYGENRWYELGNVLYLSSENTIARLHRTTAEQYVTMVSNVFPEQTELTMLTEEAEAAEEQQTEIRDRSEELVRELERVNEYNQQNVGRYRRMMELLSRIKETEKRGGGAERTRRASLKALEGSSEVLARLRGEEEESDQLRREVFREVTRLFPDNSGQILTVLEQYIEGGGIAPDSGMTVVQGDITSLMADIERIETQERTQELVLREQENADEEVQQTLERLNRLEQQESGRPGTEAGPGQLGLVHRREETLSAEELEETLSQMRQSLRRTEQTGDTAVEEVSRRDTVRRTVNDVTTSVTERNRADIAEMVNQGVRSQLGAISDEVLRKLERRLQNEKSRRGI